MQGKKGSRMARTIYNSRGQLITIPDPGHYNVTSAVANNGQIVSRKPSGQKLPAPADPGGIVKKKPRKKKSGVGNKQKTPPQHFSNPYEPLLKPQNQKPRPVFGQQKKY